MTSKKVLIIEDSTITRMLVKRTLEKYGMEVLELNNAEDFFKFPWQFKGIDLLILDVILPGISGLTALEEMRSSRDWAYLPVIMLTGVSDQAVIKRAIQAGAINYILKPFTPETLLERVEQILGPFKKDPSNNLESIVRNEVNRAIRGKHAISFIEIIVPEEIRKLSHQQNLTALQDNIKKLLREIDSIYIYNRHNFLLILPITDTEGAAAVIKKFPNILPSLELKIYVL